MKSLILLTFALLLGLNSKAQTLPDFVLIGLNGDTLSNKDLKDKRVYINVFETWCKPCAAEVPLLNTTADSLKDVIMIAITPAKTAKAQRFKEKFGLQIPIYPNAEKLCRELYASQYPSHFFVDSLGDVKRLKIILGVKIVYDKDSKWKPTNKEWNTMMLEQNQTTIIDAITKARDSSESKK